MVTLAASAYFLHCCKSVINSSCNLCVERPTYVNLYNYPVNQLFANQYLDCPLHQRLGDHCLKPYTKCGDDRSWSLDTEQQRRYFLDIVNERIPLCGLQHSDQDRRSGNGVKNEDTKVNETPRIEVNEPTKVEESPKAPPKVGVKEPTKIEEPPKASPKGDVIEPTKVKGPPKAPPKGDVIEPTKGKGPPKAPPKVEVNEPTKVDEEPTDTPPEIEVNEPTKVEEPPDTPPEIEVNEPTKVEEPPDTPPKVEVNEAILVEERSPVESVPTLEELLDVEVDEASEFEKRPKVEQSPRVQVVSPLRKEEEVFEETVVAKDASLRMAEPPKTSSPIDILGFEELPDTREERKPLYNAPVRYPDLDEIESFHEPTAPPLVPEKEKEYPDLDEIESFHEPTAPPLVPEKEKEYLDLDEIESFHEPTAPPLVPVTEKEPDLALPPPQQPKKRDSAPPLPPEPKKPGAAPPSPPEPKKQDNEAQLLTDEVLLQLDHNIDNLENTFDTFTRKNRDFIQNVLECLNYETQKQKALEQDYNKLKHENEVLRTNNEYLKMVNAKQIELFKNELDKAVGENKAAYNKEFRKMEIQIKTDKDKLNNYELSNKRYQEMIEKDDKKISQLEDKIESLKNKEATVMKNYVRILNFLEDVKAQLKSDANKEDPLPKSIPTSDKTIHPNVKKDMKSALTDGMEANIDPDLKNVMKSALTNGMESLNVRDLSILHDAIQKLNDELCHQLHNLNSPIDSLLANTPKVGHREEHPDDFTNKQYKDKLNNYKPNNIRFQDMIEKDDKKDSQLEDEIESLKNKEATVLKNYVRILNFLEDVKAQLKSGANKEYPVPKSIPTISDKNIDPDLKNIMKSALTDGMESLNVRDLSILHDAIRKLNDEICHQLHNPNSPITSLIANTSKVGHSEDHPDDYTNKQYMDKLNNYKPNNIRFQDMIEKDDKKVSQLEDEIESLKNKEATILKNYVRILNFLEDVKAQLKSDANKEDPVPKSTPTISDKNIDPDLKNIMKSALTDGMESLNVRDLSILHDAIQKLNDELCHQLHNLNSPIIP